MGLNLEPKPDEAVPAGGTASPLDELRGLYAAIDDDQAQTEVFDVEGSNVAIRYRRLPFKEVTAALTSDGDLWEQNAQLLIDACDEILIRTPDGDLKPLVEGERVTFDLRPGETTALHKVMGVQEDDVRRSVLRVFQGVDQALLRHGAAVDRWMGTVRQQAAKRFQEG